MKLLSLFRAGQKEEALLDGNPYLNARRTMNEQTATGDLLTLIQLKNKLSNTGDPATRMEIVNQMLELHQKNQWVIGYIAEAPTIHAVNARIHNFPNELVWSDIYRDMGIAHCQSWFIVE